MADNYIATIAEQVGIPLAFFIIIIIWSYIWKLLALWKSARKGSAVWFVVLALVNTVGILEILYIFVFSEMKFSKQKKNPIKKKVSRKKKVRKKK